MKYTIILFLSCFLIVASVHGQKSYYPPDHSSLDSNRYSNEYFNIKMPISSNWKILNENQIKNAISSGISRLQTDFNVQLDKDRLERIKQEELILLLLSKTSSIQDLPNLLISWEPIQTNSDILTSAEYLRGYIELSNQKYSSAGITISNDDLVDTKIDQITFTELRLELSYQDRIYAYQRIYCTVLNGCFFKIMINFESSSQKELCKKQIQMIEFK